MTVGTVVQVPPDKLIDNPANVRKAKADLASLVDSVRQVGVLEPLLVVEEEGKGFKVIAGHRRRLAAIAAGVETVPCYVTELDSAQAEVTAMMAENLARADLTPADEAKGYEQLEAFGLSAAEIAAATGRSAEAVGIGLKVAKAHKSVAVATRYDLTMEQAAGLAEFEDDKAAIVRLTEVAKKRPEQFEHELSRSRQERERLAKVAEMRAHFQSQGVKILGDRERFGYDVASKAGCYLSSLASPTGTGRMTEAEHKDCPGHAVELEMWGERYSPGCTNPKKHGHKLFRQTYAGDSRTAKPKMADLPPAEQEKARKQRRELVSNNRAWRAALPVRRKFVRELLLRKTLPKGTPRFLARVIAGHGHETGRSESDLAELLNLKTKAGYGYPAHTKLQEQARRLPDRVVLMPLLAHACAQCEYPLRLSEHTWQGSHEETAVYFRFLQSNGYGLSDVELGTCLRYEGKTAEAAQAFARNIPVDRNTPRRARAVAKKATKKGTPVTKTPARKRAVKKAKP